jgi:hypothetical protein
MTGLPALAAAPGTCPAPAARRGTLARIQAECNRLNARFLISQELVARVVLPNGVQAENVGEVDLRGKRHAVGLTVSEQQASRENQPV